MGKKEIPIQIRKVYFGFICICISLYIYKYVYVYLYVNINKCIKLCHND